MDQLPQLAVKGREDVAQALSILAGVWETAIARTEQLESEVEKLAGVCNVLKLKILEDQDSLAEKDATIQKQVETHAALEAQHGTLKQKLTVAYGAGAFVVLSAIVINMVGWWLL